MIQALKETIVHYSYLRDYGLNKWDAGDTSEPDYEKMYDDIGKDWDGVFCPLCKKYYCADCPLFENGYSCIDENSPYMKIYYSANWLEFSIACNNMVYVLNKLIEKEKDK